MQQHQDEKVKPSKSAIIRWFRLDQFAPETAVTSHWVSPKAFFAIRLILALYSTITWWVYIGNTRSGKIFAFFTTLTFIGIHAYNITVCVHHFRYLRNKNMNFMLNQPSFLNCLYVYLYCTVITFNVVTPVVYWSILFPAIKDQPRTAFDMWMNCSLHLVTFFLMIIDVVFNRMKVPIRMVLPVLITMLFYMFLAFIIYAVNGFWVYPFMNWNQGGSTAIWYFAVALIVVAAFFFQVLIHFLRDLIARKTGRSVAADTEKMERDNNSDPTQVHHQMKRFDTNQSSVV